MDIFVSFCNRKYRELDDVGKIEEMCYILQIFASKDTSVSMALDLIRLYNFI